MLKNSENADAMETHDNVPRDEVGAFIQQCIKDGAIIAVVTQNPNDRTYTVSVQRGS